MLCERRIIEHTQALPVVHCVCVYVCSLCTGLQRHHLSLLGRAMCNDAKHSSLILTFQFWQLWLEFVYFLYCYVEFSSIKRRLSVYCFVEN